MKGELGCLTVFLAGAIHQVAPALLMRSIPAKMASALRMAYLKHCENDDAVGWEELSNILLTTLTEAMGDTAFQRWLAEQREARGRQP